MDRKALVLTNPPAVPSLSNTNLADIRGIKGPVRIPSTYEWLWWTLGSLVVLAALVALWRYFRRRAEAPKPVAVVPPHRKAKDRLRNAEQLLSDPYAFCSLVSDVLRGYLEDRFDLHAPERTTEEFMQEMRGSAKLRPDHKALLEDFLARCDLVKFARFEPSQPELKGLLDAALRFIDETAPVAVAESPAVPEAKAA